MQETICSYNKCTGCSACMNICTHGAISMVEGELGHIQPIIDNNKCVDCGLCKKICPSNYPIKLHQSVLHTYAAICNNQTEHLSSSSGGAASIISRHIIHKGGVVYGCAQIDNMLHIEHIRICSEPEVQFLKGSKYVQSNINLTYRAVKKDLNEGRLTAFIGTPCQIAGLKNFLRKTYDNLITIDLICHGVPSQKIMRDNAKELGFQDLSKTVIQFRQKTNNGIRYAMSLTSPTKCITKHVPFDTYITAFVPGLSFRESCHNCLYSNITRSGDITIGDFWGLGAYEPTSFDIRKGISLILINSDRGEELFDIVKKEFQIELRDLKEAVAGNSNLNHPTQRPHNKDLFIARYKKYGLKKAVNTALPLRYRVKLFCIEHIKQVHLFVFLFKKCRLIFNQIKNEKS